MPTWRIVALLAGGSRCDRDSKPALLAGLGVRQLRVWGFSRRKNSGGFIGVKFRCSEPALRLLSCKAGASL
jgi:hypothetical protein